MKLAALVSLAACSTCALGTAVPSEEASSSSDSDGTTERVDMNQVGMDRGNWNPIPVVTLEDPAQPFANELAKRAVPTVIKGSLATQWKAMDWAMDTLAERLGYLTGVKKSPQPTFQICHDSPFDNLDEEDELLGLYQMKCHKPVDMSASDLVSKLQEGGQPDDKGHPSYYGYESPLDLWGEEMFAAAQPLVQFMVTGSNAITPDTEHQHRQTVAWVSGAGTTTACHYDTVHNMYTQVHGRKRFLLFPPQAWEQLYLRPHTHPGSHSVRVNPDDPDTEAYPNYAVGRLLGFETTLEPGDTLYIPPMWFHQVTALDPSISVSVWSPFEGERLLREALEEVPLPVLSAWSKQDRIQALRLFLESLCENLDMADGNIASFVHWTLLHNRYVGFGEDPADDLDDTYFCLDDEAEARVLDEGREHFMGALKELKRIFERIEDVSGMAQRDVLLANYMELTANAVVGPVNSRRFFHALVYC